MNPSLTLTIAASFFIFIGISTAAEHVLENRFLKRVWTTDGGTLKTSTILNKAANLTTRLESADEFQIRVSETTEIDGTDRLLTASDFEVTGVEPSDAKDTAALTFHLANDELTADLKVSLAPNDFYMRKQLTLLAKKQITLEQVDPEVLGLVGAEQPYKLKMITAAKPYGWKPGLGQPLYGTLDGTFWGIEFPAATNEVSEEKLRCGYLVGRKLTVGQSYVSHPSVMGVSDDPDFVQDAFFDYIDRTRVRPFRLQLQYNCWFDFGNKVDRGEFATSVRHIHEELVSKRGVKPLESYVIDDGWQDNDISWAPMVWPVNEKFDKDFGSSLKLASTVNSSLGLWLSPCSAFGSKGKVPALQQEGYEALPPFMSLAGPKYMQALENRMVALTRDGVSFWKLDGIFGHLNTRVFELHGARYGLPEMPQIGASAFTADDKRLNDSKYDELKTYYLSAATERLMQLFDHLDEVDPDVYLLISNAAYLSPWWLQHVDASWIINSADGASGKGRTGILVYRDSILYDITVKERTQFPINALFNHEPKKINSDEPPEEFRNYLYMALSRGTGFMEFYLKPSALKPADWDVLAEGMIWARATGKNFKRSRMHGGNPKKREIYGFTGWLKDSGYISILNPAEFKSTYQLTLDRRFGLLPGSGPFKVSSPLPGSLNGLKNSYQYGDTMHFELKPGESRILNFSRDAIDFSRISRLQQSGEN